MPSVITRSSAEHAIEALRLGVPPYDRVAQFTAGRRTELEYLSASFRQTTDPTGGALLIQATYGAGKSHLLRVIRELALEQGYAVASVTVEAQGGVRFNRMDTVMGAVCRNIEVPGDRRVGLPALFDRFADSLKGDRAVEQADLQERVSDTGQWCRSGGLGSLAVFAALRFWATAPEWVAGRDTIVNWFSFPEKYRAQRRALFHHLVAAPNIPKEHYPDGAAYSKGFDFYTKGDYRNCWHALADLDLIARASGLKGLVLLFDEFEDVIQNLNQPRWQQSAFSNLFDFFAGHRFSGRAYFAVTPEFTLKCKAKLMARQAYEFPLEEFDCLPRFQMSKIRPADFRLLAAQIRDLHGVAYDWPVATALPDSALDELAEKILGRSSQDQIRQATKALVETLDDALYSLPQQGVGSSTHVRTP